MYEDLLQSQVRPFRATPDEKFYFPHESMETAKNTIVRAVRRAEGPVMVLGGAGLGKSLLGELVGSELQAEYDLVKLRAARLCSRGALLQNILFELRMPYRGLSEGELRLSLMDRLLPHIDHAPQGVLLLVDEAHTLPSKLLEELRLITNFTSAGQPRARLVLIGSMQLEDTFTSPQLESFNQRLAARCYLTPMSREQTRQYVRHQISAAGYSSAELISDAGLQTVYSASEGVPRLANQIMDHALVLAIAQDRCPIGPQLIEEAWADLQQLPAPWQSVADLQSPANSVQVEFGELGEDDSEFSSFDIGSHTIVQETADAESAAESDPQSSLDGQNFFAAFEESLDVETHAELPKTTENQKPISTDGQLEKPEVVIIDIHRAFASGRHQSGYEYVEKNQTLPVDSFFENRQTDEKLIALEDEQHQYDSMGVWENDPPLSRSEDSDEVAIENVDSSLESESRDKQEELAASDISSSAGDLDADGDARSIPTVVADLSTAALFGDDFEEEISISREILERLPPTEFSSDFTWQTSPDWADEHLSAPELPQVEVPSAQIEQIQVEQLELDSELNKDLSSESQITTEAAWKTIEKEKDSNSPFVDDSFEKFSSYSDNEPANEPDNESDLDTTSDLESELALKQEALVEDHIARIQQFAQGMAKAAEADATVESVLQSMEHRHSDSAPINDAMADFAAPWILNISTLDTASEATVQQEIEDIVSQLNFSAFAVEPFSVEQITLQPKDTMLQSAGSGDSNWTEEESEEPLPEHQRSEKLFSGDTAIYDDDRDLLVIEEEVATVQPAVHGERLTTQTTPYAQLFAKLRK